MAALWILVLAPVSPGQSARELKSEEEVVRQEMARISKELGTTCTECHNLKNFKDDSKKSFKVAAEHMKLVALLRANGMDGKKAPEANCFVCHRGSMKAPTEPAEK